jgi:pimeloyl-ACP methyl ester carboxylesterase
MRKPSFIGTAAHSALALILVVVAASTYSGTADAKDNNPGRNDGPLVLKEQGMFYLPGDIVQSDAPVGPTFPPTFGGPGEIAVNQMYVEFMRPQNETGVPIIMIHGGNLSGACYETTPDGRMGWYEYFTRKGHAVYLPDQVSRARSGFNITPFNEVAAGTRPPAQLPAMYVLTEADTWAGFRFGPVLGTPFANEQFPVEAIDALAAQAIPDQNGEVQSPPTTNLTPTRLAELGVQIGGAVLLGHSEAGFYPEQAALQNPAGLRGLISLEPATCAPGLGTALGGSAATLSPAQIEQLAKIPQLLVFGDHFADAATTFGVNWPAEFASCQKYAAAISQAGGDVTMLVLPNVGVFGNSHMMFQDKNNLQVGDMVLSWIDQHVRGKPLHSN